LFSVLFFSFYFTFKDSVTVKQKEIISGLINSEFKNHASRLGSLFSFSICIPVDFHINKGNDEKGNSEQEQHNKGE
jgi:hypothetical protein